MKKYEAVIKVRFKFVCDKTTQKEIHRFAKDVFESRIDLGLISEYTDIEVEAVNPVQGVGEI